MSYDTVNVPTDQERLCDFSLGSQFAGTLSTQTVAAILTARNWTGTPCTTAIANLNGSAPTAGVSGASIFPTNVIPIDCQNPVASALLQQYGPHANVTDDSRSLSLFQSVPNGDNHAAQFPLPLDHRINERQQLNAY